MASDLETNRAVVGRFHREAWSRGDEAVLEQLLAPGYRRVSQAAPEPVIEGIEAAKHWLRSTRELFPDWDETIEAMVAEGDLVAVRVTVNATFRDPEGEQAGKQTRVRLEAGGFHRLQEGKIVESWVLWDNVAMLRQLGQMPPP